MKKRLLRASLVTCLAVSLQGGSPLGAFDKASAKTGAVATIQVAYEVETVKRLRDQLALQSQKLRTAIGTFKPQKSDIPMDNPLASGAMNDLSDFQFHLWRVFAYDPDGSRTTRSGDPRAITASEMTEDLENRLASFRTSTWPASLGVEQQFQAFVEVCDSIIELRKKRLYGEARTIVRRGDLEEAYLHLRDMLEQKMFSVARLPEVTPDAEDPQYKIVRSTVDDTIETINQAMDLLSRPVQEQNDGQGVGGTALLQKADEKSGLRRTEGQVRGSSFFVAFYDEILGWVETKLSNWSPSITDVFVLSVGVFSLLMLTLFLGALVSKPLQVEGSSSDSRAGDLVSESRAVDGGEVTSGEGFDRERGDSLEIQPADYFGAGDGLSNEDCVAAVMSLIGQEAFLQGMVEHIERVSSGSESVVSIVLPWFADVLDRLREVCLVAMPTGDIEMVYEFMDGLSSSMTPQTDAVRLVKLRITEILTSRITEAMNGGSYTHPRAA